MLVAAMAMMAVTMTMQAMAMAPTPMMAVMAEAQAKRQMRIDPGRAAPGYATGRRGRWRDWLHDHGTRCRFRNAKRLLQHLRIQGLLHLGQALSVGGKCCGARPHHEERAEHESRVNWQSHNRLPIDIQGVLFLYLR